MGLFGKKPDVFVNAVHTGVKKSERELMEAVTTLDQLRVDVGLSAEEDEAILCAMDALCKVRNAMHNKRAVLFEHKEE